jgi:hypothetical protein
MIEAITTTNSGKPIGRWLDETQASALISVTLAHPTGIGFIGHAALHNPSSGMAGALLAGPGHQDPGEKPNWWAGPHRERPNPRTTLKGIKSADQLRWWTF